MKLHYKQTGQGEPLIIMHGLFGTSANWGAQIKGLSENYTVYALDMRNHGKSPWADDHNYPEMAKDILEFMDDHNLEQAILLGHSMGGKAAMQLALDHPERVKKLVIVDISPVTYEPKHNHVLKGLHNVDLDTIRSRSDADQALAPYVEDVGVRQFLLKNLYKDAEGKFAWRMNLKAINKDYKEFAKAPSSDKQYTGPTFFIKGGRSSYMQDEHREAIVKFFPTAKAHIIKEAGHLPHAEVPEVFSRVLMRFLNK